MRPRCRADFRVCCITGVKTRENPGISTPADLELGDTAGLETRATVRGSSCAHQPFAICGLDAPGLSSAQSKFRRGVIWLRRWKFSGLTM